MFRAFLTVCFMCYFIWGVQIDINNKIYNIEIMNKSIPCISFIVLCILAIILAGKKWK